jgi:hypothetical protein
MAGKIDTGSAYQADLRPSKPFCGDIALLETGQSPDHALEMQ